MADTNFQEIITDLRKTGMKDADIARITKTTRQYIGAIGRGDVGKVNYELGARLVKLHEAMQ